MDDCGYHFVYNCVGLPYVLYLSVEDQVVGVCVFLSLLPRILYFPVEPPVVGVCISLYSTKCVQYTSQSSLQSCHLREAASPLSVQPGQVSCASDDSHVPNLVWIELSGNEVAMRR